MFTNPSFRHKSPSGTKAASARNPKQHIDGSVDMPQPRANEEHDGRDVEDRLDDLAVELNQDFAAPKGELFPKQYDCA